jgi:BirA family biotin operon repressor/biotin-[acetyl-CoA-carboxylase] ligase
VNGSSGRIAPDAQPLAQRVFVALADGTERSGAALAERAGVTRSAVWKAIESLRAEGLAIEGATNRGYRLASATEALDAVALRAALSPSTRARLRSLEVAWEIDSTNAALLASPPPPVGAWDVLLAENQRQGRGRRGRAWRAALGDSLCLSLGTAFEPLPQDLPAATLVVGVCVLRALRRRGGHGVALKWPNDLVLAEVPGSMDGALSKAGGILVELRAEAGGCAQMVVGIGLNLRCPAAIAQAIEPGALPATALLAAGVEVASRNALAAAVVDECVSGLATFAERGFAPFRDEWRAADALLGRAVRITTVGASSASPDRAGSVREGHARGIDPAGALLFESADGACSAVSSGEVSVREQRP